MKIVSAEIFRMHLSLSPGFDKHMKAGWRPLILKLTTDEGIVGIGEAGMAYGTGDSAAVGMIKDLVSTFVIGANPLNREAIWNDMHRKSFWGGACGPVINSGMSAIDIALWDIAGKAFGQPVWQLLGGKVQEDLRAYASQTQFGWGDEFVLLSEAEDYGAAAARAIAEGYDAIKVDPIMVTEGGENENPNNLKGALDKKIIRRATSRLASIRDAIGPDPDIILELHSLTSLTGGQQLAEACSEFDLFMVEEAVNYNSDRTAKTLKQRAPHLRMCAGERVFTRWQYRSYFEDASLDMIQPDFCLVGGITEGRKICDMAHAYEVTVQGHVCGSPISSMAAIHVETAIPNFQIHEHHVNATCMANRRICQQDLQPVNGRLTAPDEPGLGLDLDEDYVRKNSTVLKI